MKNVRLYMILQWVFFLPVILPLCIAFGALQGAYQMAERVMEQLWADVISEQSASRAISAEWHLTALYLSPETATRSEQVAVFLMDKVQILILVLFVI